jgi:hypothetical protein
VREAEDWESKVQGRKSQGLRLVLVKVFSILSAVAFGVGGSLGSALRDRETKCAPR